MKAILLCSFLLSALAGLTQTSDTQFKKPLKEVLTDIQQRYHITLRYTEELVKDRWVTYADWRFRPDVEKTLTNVLTPLDLSFAKEGENKYKVQNYLYHLKTVQEGADQLQNLASLHTDLAGWESRRAALKECILTTLQLKSLPAAPASAPIIMPARKMDGYTIENIAIETLPGVYVCGSLYKPAKAKGKMPLVLNPDGHFAKGRYRADCQYRCAVLARMGAMAFSYDLFAWDGESLLQVTPQDHRKSFSQVLQMLNTLRIMDVLLTRKDVDTSRVAITGASGGGSQTMAITAIDNRIKLSVPVVMMSSYHSGGCPCESGMGIHVCQGGTNNVEIAAMAAPRPQLVISDGKDWTQHVPENEFPFLQKIYSYYPGNPVAKNVHLAGEGHDYGASKRKAMYAFIGEHFRLDMTRADESVITIEPDSLLYVFGPKGEKLPANALKSFDAIKSTFDKAIAAQTPPRRYKVAVVDLMILKRQKLGAFQLTKDIGADGVEVDMGGLGSRPTFDNKLLIDSVRKQFLDKANELDLAIPSLAMTGYYAQSFCERTVFIQSIEDCIKTMQLMNIKIAFLPLGVQCDLLKRPELRDSVVSRLKTAGVLAEKAGVVIGIETALGAKEELKLLKDINSKGIKSYFNFSNALKNGRDLSSELEILGKDNIVQIHCTDDDGVWLENNTRLDMKKVKQTLDKMNWSGWLVIERSRDAKDAGNVKKNFGANTAYVKSIFQKGL